MPKSPAKRQTRQLCFGTKNGCNPAFEGNTVLTGYNNKIQLRQILLHWNKTENFLKKFPYEKNLGTKILYSHDSCFKINFLNTKFTSVYFRISSLKLATFFQVQRS